MIYNLICSWTVPEVITENGGRPIRDAGGPLLHQGGHGGDRRHLRRRALGPLLLQGQLPGGLGDDRGSPGSGSAVGKRGAGSAMLRALRSLCRFGRDQLRGVRPEGHDEKLAEKFGDGTQDWTDGLTVEYEDWWFNCRPSNTEPLLRLNLEARTEELMVEKRGR